MNKDFPIPLDEQDAIGIPFIPIISKAAFDNTTISIYLCGNDFAFLWFIPVEESGMVGYKNYGTYSSRNNLYDRIQKARHTYGLCQKALNDIEGCKLVWEGNRNYDEFIR